MQTTIHTCLATAAILLAASTGYARDYGVSSHSAGRGTVYTDNRGGTAYVGPRGVAAQGADGRSAAATDRGVAASGPNGVAVSGRYSSTANVGVAVKTTGVAVLPTGYITAVPVTSHTFVVNGYNCYFINGIYYRPVFYGGTMVYVPVT